MKKYRIAIVAIRNKAGEFFIHRRRNDKRRFPGLYGLGAGGKIESHEQPLEGASRELLEETGIKTTPQFLFQYEYQDKEAFQDTYVYAIEIEKVPAPDVSEWQWSGWSSPEQVQAYFDNNEFCLDDYPLWERYCEKFFQVRAASET